MSRGSIVKRGQKYAVVLTVGTGSDGKRVRNWHSGFSSRDEAEKALTKLLGELDNGNYIAPEKLTMKDFLEEEWFPSLDAAESGGRLRATTAQNYRWLCERYVIPSLGHVLVTQLTPPMLNRTYSALQAGGGRDGRPLSTTTVHAVHVAIGKALSDAVRWGRLARNPAANADPPAVSKKKMKTWDPEQTRAFLDSVSDKMLIALFATIAMTGMRRGEVCGLTFGDLDLDEGTIVVQRARVVTAYAVVESAPKTENSKRTIAIDTMTVALLRAHRRSQQEAKLALGQGALSDDDPVFAWADGRALHPEVVSKTFVRLAKKAGLPPIRLHDLRHGWATSALEAGVPMVVVSRHLGHAGIAITADTYSHVRPEVDRSAAEKVAERILGGGA